MNLRRYLFWQGQPDFRRGIWRRDWTEAHNAGVKRGATVRLLAGAMSHPWMTGNRPQGNGFRFGRNWNAKSFLASELKHDRENDGLFDANVDTTNTVFPIVNCAHGPALDE